MQTLHLAIVLFIFGGISLAVTYGCFPIFASHTGLPGLPLPFDYFRAYFLVILTTSFFALAVIVLIISRRRKNKNSNL